LKTLDIIKSSPHIDKSEKKKPNNKHRN